MSLPNVLWMSYLKGIPGDFPDDGVLVIKEPVDNKFEGRHFREELLPDDIETPIKNGVFTPAVNGTPAKIEFTETFKNVDYKYFADIREIRPGFFVTDKGKRTTTGPSGTTTDDWLGTHTT